MALLISLFILLFVRVMAALLVSVVPACFGGDADFRFRPIRALIAGVGLPLLIVGAVLLHTATLTVDVPAEYLQFVDDEYLSSFRRTAIDYGRERFTFPLYIEVVGASESGVAIETVYFVYGRILGSSPDGLYNPS